MAPLHLEIPTSTQYITFPTEGVPIRIAWSEGRQARSAIYHASKCYWGIFGDSTQVTDQEADKEPVVPPRPIVMKNKKPVELTIIGETTIFVAQEFIEPSFQGGPMLAYHVKDQAKTSDETVSNWIILQLNDCIHYGQNKVRGKWRRWLVYHPPISKNMRAPDMYQHRFMAPASAEFAKLALNALPEVSPDEYSAAASATDMIGNLGIDVLKGVVGDPLHRFLGSQGIKDANALTKSFRQLKITNTLDAITQQDRWITALQYVESLDAQAENSDSRLEKANRAQEAASYLNDILQQQNQQRSFWDKLLGRRKKVLLNQPVSSDEISAQSIDPGGDHEEVQKNLIQGLKIEVDAVEAVLHRPSTRNAGSRGQVSKYPVEISEPDPTPATDHSRKLNQDSAGGTGLLGNNTLSNDNSQAMAEPLARQIRVGRSSKAAAGPRGGSVQPVKLPAIHKQAAPKTIKS